MRLRDFIVCDDIRQEVGNKYTLVGVYDESIEFGISKGETGKWPKTLKLGFFVRVRFEPDDTLPDVFSMHVRFNGTDETKTGEGSLQFSGSRKRDLNMVLLHGRFLVPRQSTMTFFLRFYSAGERIGELSPDCGIIARELVARS